MDRAELIRRGRGAFGRKAWREAVDLLALAERHGPLGADDLERLATAANLTGADETSADAWTRAHQQRLAGGDVARAVRCAFWLGFGLVKRGDQARGSGWFARARRLLEERDDDCAEQGYLLLPEGMRQLFGGEAPSAEETFRRAVALGSRFGEPDLLALALHCRGRVLLRLGRIDEGVALLDEAMAAVDAGELSPLAVGDVYCSVIEGCLEVFDLRRAQEWTTVLTHWCESQPELVPYRGQCAVRRAEIMQFHGDWSDALAEARHACEWLTRPPGEPAAAAAFHQRGDLHRLRGEVDEAEEAYRRASELGKRPQPGLALLRLAQGDVNAAAAAIRQALGESAEPRIRLRLLPAAVEILIVAGDVEGAAHAAEELREFADAIGASWLHASAALAEGSVVLARGDAPAASAQLRSAFDQWRALEAPYETARTRELLALACRAMGDEEGAALELHAARVVLEQLGAAPDVQRLASLADTGESPPADGILTRRELEVLGLVATGRTNRAVAEALSISEKTVARHVSNIFMKIGVSSRAAATAYAYEHRLL